MFSPRAGMFLGWMLLFGALPGSLGAAVGCDLNDPDRDVKRLFPDSTGFKTSYESIANRGGQVLLEKVEQRLGDSFHGLYETADVPYTFYTIYRGANIAGYIHGVNQKGSYGGIQVFLATDPEGVIRTLYYQKLTSQSAKLLRDKNFGLQFQGLALKDFLRYAPQTRKTDSKAIARLRNPAPAAEDDYYATLRAVKKNLILMDEFLFNNRHLQSAPKRKSKS
jgi:hypothetical protein